MKTALCVLGVLLAVAAVHCGGLELKKFMDECKAELKIDGEIPHGPPNLDDPQAKCMHACFMKKHGEMVDGKVTIDKVLEMASKHHEVGDDLKAKLTDCVEKANGAGDECEVAGAFGKCVFGIIKPPQ